MPEAFKVVSAGDPRVPRTLFAHAHQSGSAVFPPSIGGGNTADMHQLIPDNWNGLDGIYLWVLGAWTGQFANFTITINIGTCDELHNVHTQTVANIVVNTVINEYECIDLTTTFETVLANLASRDMIRVSVTVVDEQAVLIMGIELQET